MKKKKITYPFDYYALLFFGLSFLGWLWEVLLYFCTDHLFINRGIYKGPYLPVYGVGGLLLCFFLRSIRQRPFQVFVRSALLCGALEYLTSFFLERKWGIRWWDYGGHFLNLNGRICLMGVSAFGLGGVLLVCLFLPRYDRVYERIPGKWRRALCAALALVFAADAAWCAMHPNVGYGITQQVR